MNIQQVRLFLHETHVRKPLNAYVAGRALGLVYL